LHCRMLSMRPLRTSTLTARQRTSANRTGNQPDEHRQLDQRRR
jgi:hypothetical protein